MVIDLTDTVLTWNAAAEQLFDVPSANALGHKFRDLDVSYRVEGLRARIEDVKARHLAARMDSTTFNRRDGSAVHADVTIIPIADGQRHFGVLVFAIEATEHARLREQMTRVAEQHATAIEELQSTNEELETTNEELQSTNEELETMNEELQSTNEELQTMNDELRNRSTELNSNNAFLEAVFTSLRSAVVVVDRELRIQVWNAGALEMWGVRAEESQGNSMFNLDIGLPVGDLHQPLREILSGAATHRELTLPATNRRGKTIRCKVSIAPLLGNDKTVTGAILLMEDEATPAGS
jgi:two-component system CheB/CheR fusion protein